MLASKPSGVASQELTEQREGALRDASVEPLSQNRECSILSPERLSTHGKGGEAVESATAPQVGQKTQETCPDRPGQPDGTEAPVGVTRGALVVDDLTATQTAPRGGWANMNFSTSWAKAGWGRCTGRGTRS